VAESSWPSPGNGRVVDDVQYEKLGISTGPSGGVYGDFTNPQLVFADSTGMQVKIASDRYALVRGHVWWSGSSTLTKTIASNSSGSTRVDLVVLQLSRTTWDATIVIVQGTPGAGPPNSTKDLGTTGIFQVVLAQVTVANSASTITAGNVTYVATHIGTNEQLRAPSVAALPYVPLPFPGMRVVLDSGDQYARNAANTAWVIVSQPGPTSFTPSYTTNGTQPVLGTGGAIESEYTLFNGKYCNYRGSFKYGTSGVTIGTSVYSVSLPFTVSSALSASSAAVGAVLMRDASGPGFYAGVCYVQSSGSTMSFVTGTGGQVTNNTPFAWAVSDSLSWEITYAIV
jgi:hypothetical protein